MKNIVYLFVLTVMLVGGCRTKPSETLPENVEVIELPEQITESISDFTDDYRYITLDVGDNVDAAIGGVTKLRVFKDKIYIMDNVFADKVLIFDMDGTFLKKVGQRGRGPQEYVDLTTFELDYEREELLLCDETLDKILVFDLDGNYKRTIRDQYFHRSTFAVLPNGDIVYGLEAYSWGKSKELEHYRLMICDSENNIKERYIEDKVDYSWSIMTQNFLNPGFDGTITFAPQFMNDVYRISGQGVEQIYEIAFRDVLDRERLGNAELMSFNGSPDSRKTIFLGNHADSKDYFYFTYEHDAEPCHVFYDKRGKRAVVSSDRSCGQSVTFDEQGNLWGAVMEAYIFFDESPRAVELKNAIAESGNPVLVVYKLKKT